MSQLNRQRLPCLPTAALLPKSDLCVAPSAVLRTGEARDNPYTSADALARVYAPTPPPRPLYGAAAGGHGRTGHGRGRRPAPGAPQHAAPHHLMPLGVTQAAQAAYAGDALRFAQAIEESQRTAVRFEERRERTRLQRCAVECERQIAAAPPPPEQLAWDEAPRSPVEGAKRQHEVMVAFDSASSVDDGEERSRATTQLPPSQPPPIREKVVDEVVDDVPCDVGTEFSERPHPPAVADAPMSSLPVEDIQLLNAPLFSATEVVAPVNGKGRHQPREREASGRAAKLRESHPTHPAAPLVVSDEVQPHKPAPSCASHPLDSIEEELRVRRMSEAARLVAAITEAHCLHGLACTRDVATALAPQPAAEASATLQSSISETVISDAHDAAELRALRGAAAADLVRSAMQCGPPPLPPLPRLTSSEEAAPDPVAASRHTSASSVEATLRQLRTALSRSVVTSLFFPSAPSLHPSLPSVPLFTAAVEELSTLTVTLSRTPAPLQAMADDLSAHAAAPPQDVGAELRRLRCGLARDYVASLAAPSPPATELRRLRCGLARNYVASLAAPSPPATELRHLRCCLARDYVASLAAPNPPATGLRAARFEEAQLLVRSVI